jgi:hypothetical protein
VNLSIHEHEGVRSRYGPGRDANVGAEDEALTYDAVWLASNISLFATNEGKLDALSDASAKLKDNLSALERKILEIKHAIRADVEAPSFGRVNFPS